MNDDLISVVVPIYNVEKYLSRCIDSIINQTYTNLEIVLVDDGSTDNCGNICDEYSKNDNRIKVIHKENGGLSDARNAGLSAIIGSYVTFIDSDDTIEKDYIKTLYELIKKYKTMMSIASYSLVNGNNITNKGLGYEETLLDTKTCLSRMLMEYGFNVSSCAKMYSTDLFENIEFPKGRLYEDNGTTYRLIMKCEKIAYSNKSIYNYIIRKNSITAARFTLKKMDYIYMTDMECNEIIKHYPDLIDVCESRMAVARFSVLRQMLNEKLKNDELVEENRIIEYLKVNYKKLMHNKSTSKKTKMSLVLLMINKNVLRIGANIYEKIK